MTALRFSVPAVISVVVGGGFFVLARSIWRYRDQPGASYFAGLQVAAGIWAGSYGVALFVFDPTLQPWILRVTWLGRAMAAPLILFFALEYTGRGHLIRSPWGVAVTLLYTVAFLVYSTNPLHGLAWTGYHIDPLFGAAVPDYRIGVATFFFVTVAYILNTVSVSLLFGSLLSYRRLFVRQITAVCLGIVLPSVANVAWLFRLGPTSHLDLTALMLFPTGLIYTYALFRGEMFELIPATTLIANDIALDDIEAAVMTLSTGGRIVDFNSAAAGLFDIEETALGRNAREVIGLDIPLESAEFSVSDVGDSTKEFNVTVSIIESPTGERIGYVVSFYDITDERRRQQRLSVQNRILRHNLRNGLDVVHGNAQMAKQAAVTEDVEGWMRTIEEKSTELKRISEKVREFDRALSEDPRPISLRELCRTVVDELRDQYTDAVITVNADAHIEIFGQKELLKVVLREATENGIVHADADQPRVTITLREASENELVVDIEDNGPGIPDHELAVVRSGDEEPLSHGSSVGLWIIDWGVDVLGGTVSFENTDSGTVVGISLPHE